MDPYQELGVSSTKAEVHEAISELPPPLFPGAFCHIVGDPTDANKIHILHADGAGTKANVAYIAYKLTGDVSWFRGLAQDSAVMNIDDVICAGITNGFFLSNTIGRNAALIPGAVLKSILQGYREFTEKMGTAGVDITLTGGEIADSGDTVRTLVVDSTVYAAGTRSSVIDFSGVKPGDVIVGLSSTGRATYEGNENSGIGSNGLTLARHALLSSDYAVQFPETYAPELDLSAVYRGELHIEDPIPGTKMMVGEALLAPARSYAPIVKEILSSKNSVSGIVHNTGGGLTKCLKFGRGLRFVKSDLFALPPVFEAIHQSGKVDMRTMLRTFNCGHRLEVFCSADGVDHVVRTSDQFGVSAKVIGEVCQSRSGNNEVQIQVGTVAYNFT